MDEERSDQLEQVARQADRQIRHGFELAGRGAYFAARSEFIGALRLVAEGLDAEQKTNVHGSALAAALTAIKEAEDFLPDGARLEANMDLAPLIAAHSTPVLKDHTEKMTPMEAMRCYLTFAQEQFAAAAGREVAGSMALRALGKLHNALGDKKGGPAAGAESKAMVFYQAALIVYPNNFMAANDLGVLLAQCGEFTNARAMLEHSLSLSRQPDTWSNLAVVYQQLGEKALADRAARQSALLRQAALAKHKMKSPTSANDTVNWVEPSTFAKTSMNTPNSSGATSIPPARTAGLPVEPGRALPAGLPAGSTNQQASAPKTSPDSVWPAPTPAAAQRTMWGSPAYQR
jgi:tetratricopeptide (TPR) repeat protein